MLTALSVLVLVSLSTGTVAENPAPLRRGISGSIYGLFLPKDFHRLQNSLITSYSVIHVQKCCLFCLHNLRCVSVNYGVNPTNGFHPCELLEQSMYESPQNLAKTQNFHHYYLRVSLVFGNYVNDKYAKIFFSILR